MTNPYGITQVDVPGALAAYEAGQTNRVNRLYRQQQLQMLERQSDRQQRFDEMLLGSALTPQREGERPSPLMSAYSPQNAGAALGESMAAGSGGMVGTPAPAAAPTPSQGVNLPPEVMRQLAVIDPERANQIFTALNTMDTAQRQRMQASNLFLANTAQHLLANVPEAQWGAEIQRLVPTLMANGITQEQIAGFVPTAQNLRGIIQQSMDVERLASVANPRYMEVGPGADLLNVNARGPDGAPQPGVVYQSPTQMVNGVPYARPQTQQFRDGETRTINGVTYTRQGGVWRAQGGAQPSSASPAWPTPVLDEGGAGSSPRTFP